MWVILLLTLWVLFIVMLILLKDDSKAIVAMVGGVVLVVLTVVIPVAYYDSRSQSWGAEIYYNNLIAPNIQSSGDDWVSVKNPEAAIWQAGSVNTYNTYLVKTRYWQRHWLGQFLTYPVPEGLKYVRIGEN